MTPEERRAADFIRANLPLAEVPGTGGIRLHLAAPASGLARLVPPGGAPYWTHAWPGGMALAAHFAATLAARGRVVLELGQGSGLASIAALRAGASGAVALDRDPLATIAARLNAEANGVRLHARTQDLRSLSDLTGIRMEGRPLVVAGDVFYDADTAAVMAAAFDALAGIADVLVGDIGRPDLPRERLDPLASYPVRDVGDPPAAPAREGWVFRWR